MVRQKHQPEDSLSEKGAGGARRPGTVSSAVPTAKGGTEGRTAHYIHERQQEVIVLDDLRRVTYYARQKEKLFLEHISRCDAQAAKREADRLRKELDKLKSMRQSEQPCSNDRMRTMFWGASQTNNTIFSPPSMSRNRK